MNTELQMKQPGALGTIPVSLEELAKDAELGGQLTLQDIAVPYLYILQGLSPQVNPDSEKYIEGAKPGMLFVSNLDLVFDGRDKGLLIVPCFYERLVTEWVPREKGGGLIASHNPDTPLLQQAKPNDKGIMTLPDGHNLIDTAYHYMLAQHPENGTWYQCIAPFKGTALKASRRMNSIVETTNVPGTKSKAPRFLYKWLFRTKKEQKDTHIWSSPALEQLDIVTADIYAAAKSYAIVAAKGLLRRAAIESELEAVGESSVVTNTIIDDEVPF